MKKYVFSACLIVSSVFTFSQAAPQYTITDLGTLGGTLSVTRGINDKGQVVGYSDISGDSAEHAFLYDGGVMVDIDTLGGTISRAYSINDSGHVVGVSHTAGDSDHHAFMFDGTEMIDLGTLGGYDSYAYGINNSGLVVGKSDGRAFLYDGSEMHDLGTLGGAQSGAYGINDSGQIVGSANIPNHRWHAFLYEEGEMHDIGTLEGGIQSFAYDINDSGQVVGSSYTGNSTRHAFLYEGGVMTDLGTLGGSGSRAEGINDSGQIVGYSDGHAFLYDGTEGMLDLNDLIPSDSGWELKEARDINSSGQIAGWGRIGGEQRAFVLIPVPEPISLDIKPGSCPNPVNVKGTGVLPVAILGTEEFDVSTIDPASIFLNGVPTISSSYEDVGRPVADPNECECTTEAGDGFGDLTLKFKTQDIVEALGEVNTGDILTLALTGVLNDETSIEGTDCVVIVGRFKPINKADINKDGVVNTIDMAIVAENWLRSSIVEE